MVSAAPPLEPAMATEAEPLLDPSTTETSHRTAAASDAQCDGRCDDDGHASSCAGALDHDSGLKIPAAMFGFLLQGLFTAGVGAIIPLLEATYNLSDTAVSLLFLSTPLGYLGAAALNGAVHRRLGQRGVAVLGPLGQLVYAVAAAAAPPFPLLLAAACVGSVGTGLVDAAWCAWSAGGGQLGPRRANRVQGFLHGAYSAGAGLGPAIVGALTAAGWSWHAWYALLALFVLIELVTSVFAFRHEDAARYRERNACEVDGEDEGQHTLSGPSLFGYPAAWICGAFMLAYVGIETSITGWIVVYMTRTRRTSLVVGGLFSSLFNLGMGVGRLVLGFLTDRLGLRRAVTLYLVLALGFQALFTVVWRPPVSAAAICLLGLVLGPMYPSGITMLVSFLPRSLHVQAVASVALLGQVGGAVMPFGQGLVAETLGIQSYPYIVFAQLGILLVVWSCFPKRSRV